QAAANHRTRAIVRYRLGWLRPKSGTQAIPRPCHCGARAEVKARSLRTEERGDEVVPHDLWHACHSPVADWSTAKTIATRIHENRPAMVRSKCCSSAPCTYPRFHVSKRNSDAAKRWRIGARSLHARTKMQCESVFAVVQINYPTSDSGIMLPFALCCAKFARGWNSCRRAIRSASSQASSSWARS